jgi:type VI secretion system secreted protein Hcp
MAFDTFMKIDGIEGESSDDKYKGWIEVIRYGIGVKQTVSIVASSAGGASAERADFSDFVIRKLMDRSSPKLALACAAGTHINQIIVELCRAGTEKIPFMTYTLKNCLIRKVITTDGNDTIANFPAETVKINFGKIEWRYAQQRRQGGGAAGYSVSGWDLQRNCRM